MPEASQGFHAEGHPPLAEILLWGADPLDTSGGDPSDKQFI